MNKFEKGKFRQELTMVIDLDERGSYKGHVENQNGKTVFEFSNEGEDGWPDPNGFWLVEDGFMAHGRDVAGLHAYLRQIGIADQDSTLTLSGWKGFDSQVGRRC